MTSLRALRFAPAFAPLTAAGSLYALAYEAVAFSAWQRIVRKRPIAEHGQRLQETQWLPVAERDAEQLVALRALLEHAGARVPYWREVFRKTGFDPRGVRSARDLTALPVLTREIIQERFDDLVDPATRGKNIRKGTSGTSGVPLKFEYDNQSEAWRQAIRLRGYAWAGYRLGMPTLHYWGTGQGTPRGLAGQKIRLDHALRREVYVDANAQDPASMRRAAATIARMRPHMIIAYTQALAGFARWVDENGARDWPDIPILCAAEALLPHDRAALGRAFGPHVFETYGSRETMLVAAECDAHDGMHLSEENLLVELAQNGSPVDPGQTGDVLVTDLHNTAMPFIRYANGDLATGAPEGTCACGRTLRKLLRVEGRSVDTLHNGDGTPVPGMLFISLLQTEVQMMRAFQVVQKPSGELELKVVRGPDWSEERFTRAVERLRAYFQGLPLQVTFVDAIAPSKSGKRRPVVVERSAEA